MAQTYTCGLMLYSISLITTVLLSQVPSLEVHRRDNVLLPCSFLPVAGGYLAWFRLGPNESVPLCILSLYVDGRSEVVYHNGFTQDHIKLHKTNSTCEIINVDLSDSGLYFCGKMEAYVEFDKATLVKVQGRLGSTTGSPTTSEKDDCKGSGFYFPLLWALGGVIAIQLVFIFIIVWRFACRGTNNTGKKSQQSSEDKRDQDPDTLNYAALNFTEKKRKPRRREELDPHVIYAATR